MQRLPVLALRTVAALAVALAATSSPAQGVAFKNFKRYPTIGQWQQEFVGYRDNKPMGPPATTTTCSSPLDAKQAAAMMEAMKGVAGTCTAKVLTDQERFAESETVCKAPAGVQTLHMQMRAVDDKTIAVETRSSLAGMPDMVTKGTSTYLGACPPGAEAAQAKAKSADCAEFAKMRQDNEAAGGAAQCAQLPPQYRAQCEAGQKMMAVIGQQCK